LGAFARPKRFEAQSETGFSMGPRGAPIRSGDFERKNRL